MEMLDAKNRMYASELEKIKQLFDWVKILDPDNFIIIVLLVVLFFLSV